MSEFKELWTLKISHDYFERGVPSEGELVISDRVNMLLRRRGLILIHKGASSWILISITNEAFSIEDNLELEYVFRDPSFLYYTQLEPCGYRAYEPVKIDVEHDSAIEIRNYPEGKQSIMLSVSLSKLSNENHVTSELIFTSKCLYFEYWLVPRDRNINRKLCLEVDTGEFEFKECTDSNTPLGVPMIKFRSTMPIKMKDRRRDGVTLYEILPSGARRPLMRNLPLPMAGRIPNAAKDTAVQPAYF